MNEQTADSYYDYDYKEPPVKTVSTRSVCLLVVGLLGMLACATYALLSICPKLYFWCLQENGECLLKPETFGRILTICGWSARASVLGCYVVLLVSHVKWRQSLTCWLGTVGTGLMIVCHVVLALGLSSTDQQRGLFVLLLGITSLVMLLPLFKMGCLVPGGARFIGTMGATMLIIVNVFFSIVQTIPFFQPDWAAQRNELMMRYGEMFGVWFPFVANLALLVFFFVIFLSRDKTFEQVPTAWYEGRARRSEYWGKAIVLTLVGAGGAFALFFGTGDLPDGFTETFFKDLLVAMLWAFPFYIATIPVTVRRLHDRNMSGWWILWFPLLSLLPVIGWVVPWIQLVILWLLDGTPGPNLYGPDPKGRMFAQFPGYAAAQPAQVNTAEQQQRLRRLQNLKNEGYISEAEYQTKRDQILSEM